MDVAATKAHARRDIRIMEVNFQECKGTTKSPVVMLHDGALDFMMGANDIASAFPQFTSGKKLNCSL